MSVTKITQANIDDNLKKEGYILIDFWADWCGPCKVMAPIFESLSDDPDLKGIHFTKVNVDENPTLSGQFGIRSLPTFALYKIKGDGNLDVSTDLVKKFIGTQDGLKLKMDLQGLIKERITA